MEFRAFTVNRDSENTVIITRATRCTSDYTVFLLLNHKTENRMKNKLKMTYIVDLILKQATMLVWISDILNDISQN